MNMEFLEPLLARLRLIVGRCVITATKYKDGEMLSDIGLVADEKRRVAPRAILTVSRYLSAEVAKTAW